MDRHSTAIAPLVTLTPPPSPSHKRKRDDATTQSELEVDVLAPEPPSKKALRKAKKGKYPADDRAASEAEQSGGFPSKSSVRDSVEDQSKSTNRSEYGVWIGNLPWTYSKSDLRGFFVQYSDITDDQITRVHMPPPGKASLPNAQPQVKPENKGFAYVDFSTSDALDQAIGLSEKLVSGRRVLIKHAKSFEGRPEPVKLEDLSAGKDCRKLPSKRVFVGNLGFDIKNNDLLEHFGPCGKVLDVHVATFEDTGKCKGYGWVEFQEVAASETAVRGWYTIEKGDAVTEGASEDADSDTQPNKKPKQRKWWVNKLRGRPLRMEFAEDKAVRYKKRFGKGPNQHRDDAKVGSTLPQTGNDSAMRPNVGEKPSFKPSITEDRKSRRKIDPRDIKPGAALAAAPRSSGAIVESLGKKIVFD